MAEFENSHTRNVAALRQARNVNLALGNRYKPVSELLANDALDTFCNDCATVLSTVHHGELDFENASDARQSAYEGLEPYGTRVINTLIACEAPGAVVDTARGYLARLRGERIEKPEPAASDAPAEDIKKQISVSQRSYESREGHFRKLVELCQHHGPLYRTNEDDMSLPALESRLALLHSSNAHVGETSARYTAALVARDRLLYDDKTGIVARMQKLRSYYASAFGAGSTERKQLEGLHVRTLRNRRLAEA